MEIRLDADRPLDSGVVGQRRERSEVSTGFVVRGLGGAAAFGAALAVRSGPLAMLGHGAGATATLALAIFAAAPTLWVATAHAGLPIGGAALVGAAARGAGTAGRTLLGLAPAMALVAVAAEGRGSSALAGAAGLGLGAVLGFRAFRRAMPADTTARWVTRIAALVTALASVQLALTLLPALRAIAEVLP